MRTSRSSRSAFKSLVKDVERQRIAWLEGTRDLRFSGRQVAPGIVLAGRSAPGEPVETAPESVESAERAVSLGPFGGEVHALAASPDGELVYAGTHAGIFRSTRRRPYLGGSGTRAFRQCPCAASPSPPTRQRWSMPPPTPGSSEAKTAETAGRASPGRSVRFCRRAWPSTAGTSTSEPAAAACSGAKTEERRFSGRRSGAARSARSR